MSEKFQPFDLWLPTVQNFMAETRARITELRRRFVDAHGWGIVRDNSYLPGIVAPVSAMNTKPNLRWIISQFPVRLNINDGTVDVGFGADDAISPPVYGGIAYDLNGERIAVPATVPYDPVTGLGNVSIPLTVNPLDPVTPVVGTYYLWIEYAEDADTSIPVTDKLGAVHYPVIHDGYRVKLTAAPVPPSGDGISIFLCRVIWFGGSPGGFASIQVGVGVDRADDSTGVIPAANFLDVAPVGDVVSRIYCMIRDNAVEVELDFASKTTSYSDKELASLRAHVLAIGGATPTPDNPHGTAQTNIPGSGAEPIAIANQNASLDRGLVDTSLGQNSPAYVSPAFKPVANSNVLQPVALDSAATGATPALDISAKDAFVKIAAPDNSVYVQAAFASGRKLTLLYPTMAQTTSANGTASDLDGWVGFANADTPGTYVFYGEHVTLSTAFDVLLLNKMDKTAFDAQTDDLKAKKIVLGQVYWDGNDLWQDQLLAVQTKVIDLRGFGLVGPKQPSTELKSNPDTGGLSQQSLENLIANSNYFFGVPNGNATLANVTNQGLDDVTAVIPETTAGKPVYVDAATDPTLASGGPGAVTGMTFTSNIAASGLGSSRIYHLLANLKPNRFYGISFFYKASPAGPIFTPRMRVGLSSGVGGAPTSFMTLDGITPADPIDVAVVGDGLWHRASLVVKTLGAAIVNPDPAQSKYLQFRFDQGGLALTADQMTITNILVTEGEWIPGYVAGRYIPAGGNIFFDKLSACPAGFAENEAMRGMLPLGWMPSTAIPNPGVNGLQTPGTSLNDPIYDGTLFGAGGAGGAIDEGSSFTGAAGNAKYVEPTHTTPLPFRVGIWCEAI